MAVFTAIATAIVAAIGVTGVVATIATGLIATGLAIGTAKLLGVYEKPATGTGQDPGVKIQLPPATDNKIPRLYGRNYTGSVIFDAAITNENKTMTYAMVISEYNDEDVWTINSIYRDDAELLFSGATVTGQIDPNATSATNISGKIRCRVYAGGSSAAKQIFPVGNTVNAYDIMPGWTVNHSMEDLVFAIFEMDYDSENGLTALGAITYDINNNLTNPANVLLDYLRNERYGAGLANTFIDTSSFDDWRTFSAANVSYVNNSNVTVQHSRYQIDGALSTFNTVKQNINKICLSGGAFFTYNNKLGKFGVVPTRAVSNAYIANAFVFNDDNIVSSINIGSTELFSLYNAIEIEYPSVNQKDQTDVYYAELEPAVLNPNEPYNKLDYRLDMVNDGSRVAQLANIDLNQSRFNTVLSFTADFSAMQVDVGDVTKVTSELYGYVNRLFRVMRVTEKEDAEGVITVDLTLLEYSSDVYDDLIGIEDLPKPVTGISNWWVTNGNASLSIGDIIIVNDPTGTTANIHDPATGTVIANTPIANVRAAYGSMFSNTSTFINVPITVPANVNYNTARVVIENTANANVNNIVLTQGTGNANLNYFEPNTIVNFGINTFEFDENTGFRMVVDMFDTITGVASLKYSTGTFQVTPSNVINSVAVAPGAAGINFIENIPPINIANADVTSSPTTINDPTTFDTQSLYYYTYPTATVTGNVLNFLNDPANNTISSTFGDTKRFYIGTYVLDSSCTFTGQFSNIASLQYGVSTFVDYTGNVVLDQALVANVDYVTNGSFIRTLNLPINTPVYSTFGNVQTTGFSTLTYRYGTEFYNITSLPEIRVSYGFTVYPNAKLISISGIGATTVENTIDGQRGMTPFFSISAGNKSYFDPNDKLYYPSANI
jgi:hypothetical protein